VVYAVLMLAYVRGQNRAVKLLSKKPAYTFGLPISGLVAFAIVVLLDTLSPGSDANGVLEFEAFDLTFSGPAGPVALWLVCYLSLVVSIRLVSNRSPDSAPSLGEGGDT